MEGVRLKSIDYRSHQSIESIDQSIDLQYLVIRTVGKAARIPEVLAGDDIFFHLLSIDVVQAAEHRQRGEHPPRVADVGQLLGASFRWGPIRGKWKFDNLTSNH